MPIPALPALDRTSPTFKGDLDTFFLSQLPATTAAFNAEIDRINAIGYGSYNASSTTSLTIGLGIKSLTIEAGKGYVPGQALLIASSAAPANYMAGIVNSYDSGTGALVVSVTDSNGSGSATDWVLSITATGYRAPTINQRTITGADTLIVSDQGKLINASGTFTLSVPAAAAMLGSGWYCYLRNTSNGDVTVDPNASEQIDGATTYVLKPGFTVLLACTGTAFDLMTLKQRTYNNTSSHTATGSFVVPADTYVIRGYAWGAGADGTSTQGGAGGGCAYGDIAVTPGETVSVSISSGTAIVTTASIARLTGSPASGTTPGSASKHAAVTNGGSYRGGYGYLGGTYGGAASGSPLGNGGDSAAHQGGTAWGGYIGFSWAGAGVGQGGKSSASAYPGGGSLRTPANAFTDPLLRGLTGSGGTGFSSAASAHGGDGGPGGGGGGAPHGGGTGGEGGVGAGGGGGGARGGNSLFGGGGGSGSTSGGNGGLGGGGGGAGAKPGTGGAACVLIYY